MRDLEPTLQPVIALWRELRSQDGSSEAVHATLREAILSKAIRPGQQVSEEDFAQAFGLSRTPIREAILRLESEHLVERRGRRRLSVSDISPAEVLEIYEVRVVLDTLAAELAAAHITAPELVQLRWLNERMESAGEAEEFARMSQLNLEFHDRVAQASRNSFLLTRIRGVHDRVRRFDGTTFTSPGRWQAVITEHEAVLEALRAQDSRRARAAANAHMASARRIRLAMLGQQ